MIAWNRLALDRSGSGSSAIFPRTSRSPSALSPRGPRRAAALSSWARSRIAARSTSVKPLDVLPVATVFEVLFVGLMEMILLASAGHCQAQGRMVGTDRLAVSGH